MKYEDLDSYIEELFQQPTSPQGSDLPDFGDRLSNVEQAILDAYENAMRWHSAQIAPDNNQAEVQQESSSWDDVSAPGYTYWNEETSLLSPRSAAVALTGGGAGNALGGDEFWEPDPGGLTCGEALLIVVVVLFVFIFMVLAS